MEKEANAFRDKLACFLPDEYSYLYHSKKALQQSSLFVDP